MPSRLAGRSLAWWSFVALVAAAGCARVPRPAVAPDASPMAGGTQGADSVRGGLPEVPAIHGPLALTVTYPAPGATVAVRDSSFLFGSTGTGDAQLTINGAPVRVWPNGAWIAWLPFPRDSVMRFHLRASASTDSAVLDYALRRPPERPGDSLIIFPQGRVWWPADEYLPLVAYAPAGSVVRVRLPDGTLVPLTAQADLDEVPAAVRAFDLDSQNLVAAVRRDRYVGLVRGRAIGAYPGPVLDADTVMSPKSGAPAPPMVEAIRGADTVRAAWPIRLALLDSIPLAVVFDDDTARRGDTDSLTVGRATPGGSYHWFFPTGTRAIVTGRINRDLRVRLGAEARAWVPAADAHPLPAGTAVAQAVVGSLTLRPSADRVALRVPVGYRIPFQVTEGDRSLVLHLYGAVGDVDWIRYGAQDSLVRHVTWAQVATDEVAITIDLAAPVWGYRARWERSDLILEIRRPPVVDEHEPLRHRLIVVDAGHPPGGATGPTGLREAEANLAVALRLRRLLEAAGATVLLTRTADTAIDLWPRVKFAEAANADLLISIHNNALPDGLNPFVNNGTSVFYNHPRSVPLARDIQAALLRRLGLRDLGIGRGDLALVRSTWMPSVLCEGLFMILPDQEAALRSPEGQQRYAEGVFEGVRRFVQRWAPKR
jgi:N-acetylmuramoyl-L-alanine amidase